MKLKNFIIHILLNVFAITSNIVCIYYAINVSDPVVVVGFIGGIVFFTLFSLYSIIDTYYIIRYNIG